MAFQSSAYFFKKNTHKMKELKKGSETWAEKMKGFLEKLKEARTLADELASEEGLDIQITMTVKALDKSELMLRNATEYTFSVKDI